MAKDIQPNTAAAPIAIPPKKIRTVTIGVVFAIVFASLGVGFAFGRVTAAASAGSGSSFTGFPGGGFRPGQGSGPGTAPGGGQLSGGGSTSGGNP
jgi:hypothetical protein